MKVESLTHLEAIYRITSVLEFIAPRSRLGHHGRRLLKGSPDVRIEIRDSWIVNDEVV